MSNSKIYLFHPSKINFLNLPQGMYLFNEIDNLAYPCECFVVDNKFIGYGMNQQFVNIGHLTEEYVPFRQIKWTVDSTRLNTLINLIKQTPNKSWFIGNFDHNELVYLKKYHLQQSIIVGVTYKEENYYPLLEKFADYHVYLQDQGMLQLNERDTKIRALTPHDQLVNFYIEEFDRSNIVPKFNHNIGYDYFFTFEDLLDTDCLVKKFKEIDVVIKESTLNEFTKFINYHN